MGDHDWLAEQFEANRAHLRGIAYRMLGSLAEADDAVQEAWLRLSRTDATAIENLGGWLTTVVSRVSLDMLRSRQSRREETFAVHVPDPVVRADDEGNPEHAAVEADAVGLALLVVLETLDPAERLAFVLHDVFGVPFDEIAPIVDRSPAAARQLASRARRRVQGSDPDTPTDRQRQRDIVRAFVAASREGNFADLLHLLDPDVVLRLDRGPVPAGASREVRGATNILGLGFRFSGEGWVPHHVLVNGTPGLVITNTGYPFSVIGFAIAGGRITAINILGDPARVRRLELPPLDTPPSHGSRR